MKTLTHTVMALTVTCLTLAGCQKQNNATVGNTINDMVGEMADKAADNTVADSADITMDKSADITDAGAATNAERLKYKEVKVLKTDDTGDLRVKIEMDYPISGPQATVESVRKYIMEQIEDPFYYGANSTRQKPHYTGDTNDYEALVDFYMQAWLEYLAEDRPPRGTHMETEFEIDCKAANQRFVSYEVKLFQFMGGSHPNRTQTGMTFRAADGKRVKRFFDVVPEEVIKNGIANDVDDDEKEFVRESGLPYTAPYMSDDNEMKFVYQENEIAPYVVGIIEAEIDIDDIRQYLNDEAKKLLGDN